MMKKIGNTLKEFRILSKIHACGNKEFDSITELCREINENATDPVFRKILECMKEEEIIIPIDTKKRNYSISFKIDNYKLEKHLLQTSIYQNIFLKFLENMSYRNRLGLKI